MSTTITSTKSYPLLLSQDGSKSSSATKDGTETDRPYTLSLSKPHSRNCGGTASIVARSCCYLVTAPILGAVTLPLSALAAFLYVASSALSQALVIKERLPTHMIKS